jgi:hypothetical protein
VYNITDNIDCTVRDYVDKIEATLDSSDHIFKGESDGEDLSQLNEDTIWTKLKNRIYDSTLTLVMISKNMKDTWKTEKNQWIPREISYSLKEVSRVNSSGVAVTSKTNAVLAIVVPDQNNSYSYYLEDKKCCTGGCKRYKNYSLFTILSSNMFNLNEPSPKICNDGLETYTGDYSYISVAKWDDFINEMDKYINKAYEIQNNIDIYDITKEV